MLASSSQLLAVQKVNEKIVFYCSCCKDIFSCVIFSGILKYFSDLGEENPDMSAAVAAIKTLLHYLENNRCKK